MGGRRPTLWDLRDDYGFVIGIQLVINDVHAVLVNLKSEIVDEFHIPTKRFKKINDVKKILHSVVERMISRNDFPVKKLLGIGIGVSGIVDISSGTIIKTSLIDNATEILHLEELLSEYKVPVYVENDANAAVLAEKWFGEGKGYENIVFALSVIDHDVFGLGFGLVVRNEIYRGANMFAGEIASRDLNLIKILREYCGFSGDKIILGDRTIHLDDLELDDLISAKDEGLELVSAFFEHVSRIISKDIINIINLLDPEMLIIGGAISKAGDLIMNPLRKAVEKKCLLYDKRKLILAESSLSEKSVPLGAAAIILQNIFQNFKLPSHQ